MRMPEVKTAEKLESVDDLLDKIQHHLEVAESRKRAVSKKRTSNDLVIVGVSAMEYIYESGVASGLKSGIKVINEFLDGMSDEEHTDELVTKLKKMDREARAKMQTADRGRKEDLPKDYGKSTAQFAYYSGVAFGTYVCYSYVEDFRDEVDVDVELIDED